MLTPVVLCGFLCLYPHAVIDKGAFDRVQQPLAENRYFLGGKVIEKITFENKISIISRAGLIDPLGFLFRVNYTIKCNSERIKKGVHTNLW